MKRFLSSFLLLFFIAGSVSAQVMVANGSSFLSDDLSNSTSATGKKPATTFTTTEFEPGTTTAGIVNSNSATRITAPLHPYFSNNTDYFRSVATGLWSDPTTWESSIDNLTWVAATLAPDNNANAITIQNGTTVTLTNPVIADQLTILFGGTLVHPNLVLFTLNDGLGTDMTINSGGTYVLNGTEPLGIGTVDVMTGGVVRVDDDVAPSESDDFASGSTNGIVTFENGSIYEWNTTFRPAWSGRFYFTPGNNAIFRFSQSPAPAPGGILPTIIFGTLEANAPLTMTGTGAKHFTNGIIGTANIDASGAGPVFIDGTTAVLGGGTFTAPATGLQIGSGTTVNMTSNKTIIGDVQLNATCYIILGIFDLTVTSTFTNYGSGAYVKTDGSGTLRINNITTTKVFPVGRSSFNPVVINNASGSNYGVRVEDGINPPPSLPTYGINRTWYLSSSILTAGVEVGFFYYAADANPGATPQPMPMEILLYSGGAWSITNGNTNIIPVGGNPYSVTTTALGALAISTTPVAYVLGKSGGWILPLDYVISCRAQKRNNTGIINWTVNNSTDVTSFDIQRSVNNSGFQTIGTVNAIPNQIDFSFTDPALSKGTNLYRIKVNRLVGSVKYSNTVAVIYDSNDLLITSLAPNPVNNIATLTLSTARQGSVDFKVYSISGSLVKQWQSNIAEGNNTIEMNVTGLPAGIYHILASTPDARTVTRFVKQ